VQHLNLMDFFEPRHRIVDCQKGNGQDKKRRFGHQGDMMLSDKDGERFLKYEGCRGMVKNTDKETDASEGAAARVRGRRRLVKCVAAIAGGILVALYVIGGFAISNILYSQNLARNDIDKTAIFIPNLTYNDIDQESYPRTEFRFFSGDNELVGYEYGTENSRGLVVISAGNGGTADDYMDFATRFVDDGFRVITYDMTGAARSEGDSMRGTYQGALDVDALLSYVEKQSRFEGLPVFLLGHSWGGYGICAALVNPHHVNAVVSLAGYSSGSEVFNETGAQTAGVGFYALCPHLWVIQRLTFGSAMDVTATDGINAVDIPVLIIQDREDEFITTDGLSIYAHRGEITNDKTEYLLTDGSHEFSCVSEAARAYQEEMRASWDAYAQRPGVQTELSSGDVKRIQAAKFAWAREVKFDKVRYSEFDENIIKKIENLFDAAA
jgi:alpha-beta hydrolase superfamily lysophospholipase